MPAIQVRCDVCSRNFVDSTAYYQHAKTSRTHNLRNLYDPCGEVYASHELLVAHLLEHHPFCATCCHLYPSEASLEGHYRGSKTHRPTPFDCPGRKCRRSFVSISAVTSHLESGACPSKMNRAAVNLLVVRLDGNNFITNTSRLIQGPDGYKPPPLRSTTKYATESSWNGTAYECFMCHNEFRKITSLEMHMRSPTHDERIYLCPNKAGCKKEFPALSGLCQHVERDSCGVQRFQYAKEAVESLMVGLRKLEI